MRPRRPRLELNALEIAYHDREYGQSAFGSGTGSPTSGVCE